MKEKEIKEFCYLYVKDDNFKHEKHEKGLRERNDIIYVKYNDGTGACRIYFNNIDRYAEVPYDSIMISELSAIT